MYTEHVYDIEITSDDPQHAQPEALNVQLKPHQLAALHKAVIMETTGRVYYNVRDSASHIRYRRVNTQINGQFHISTNMGVMGDIVGYGKTLTALALIAAVPVSNIHQQPEQIYSSFGRNHVGHFTAITDRNVEAITPSSHFIHTTLVIVPRGPVYVQWERALEQTKLRKLCIDSLPTMRRLLPSPGSTFAQIKEFFERYDAVLIKGTCIRTLLDFYHVPFQEDHPLTAWNRVMVDEAHDILCKIPMFSFKFLWMISATYQAILDRAYGTRNQLGYVVRDILQCEERLNLTLVRGQSEFVKRSFDIPEPVEHHYLCELQRDLAAVQPFLTPAVQERINANDIAGAIREVGGSDETEGSLVELVTREIERDIANKEREHSYIQSLDIPDDQRENRLSNINNELTRLRDRKQSLIDRITALSEKSCSICYENYTNPIMLPCTHVFCGACLINWMQAGHVCPECRTAIRSRELIAIVEQKSAPHAPPTVPKSKEDTLMDIIQANPDGKFLVFTTVDAGFWSLVRKFEASGVLYAEMKGSTAHMMRILNDFRENRVKVILLNTYYAGSGIDMSFATDVILFHAMGLERVQAIGRAQRQGRTEPLHIHNLYYPHEMTSR